MVEWHLSPDYIVNNWTDELLDLMMQKLIERKDRETEAIQGDSGKTEEFAETPYFGDTGFIKVVKNGN